MPILRRVLPITVLLLLAAVRPATEAPVTPQASTTASAAPGVPVAPDRPNLVLVLLDDARYDDLIDHPFAELPNL